VTIIERRALANKFLGIMSIYEEGQVKTNEPTKTRKRRRRLNRTEKKG
jgi:hypothetical protein